MFYHFGFEDVVAVDPKHAGLKRKLDMVPTSFKLADEDARLLDEAVHTVITPTNPCMQQFRALVLAAPAAPEAVAEARKVCLDTEGHRRQHMPWP